MTIILLSMVFSAITSTAFLDRLWVAREEARGCCPPYRLMGNFLGTGQLGPPRLYHMHGYPDHTRCCKFSRQTRTLSLPYPLEGSLHTGYLPYSNLERSLHLVA